MSRRILLRPGAERDLDVQAEYIAASSGGTVALRFYRSAEQTFQLIARRPGIGRRIPYRNPLLAQNNSRRGFLDHGTFVALREALPTHLKDPVTFLYLSGWRVSEMRTLEWRDVDLKGREVCLRPERSKNKEGRPLPLRGEMLEIFLRARQARRPDCPSVFHDAGEPTEDFREAWKTSCKAAGVSGIIVHDLRRTAVRNMVRAGIPERVAMELSGHKTRRIFDRYNIVSSEDLAAATERLQTHLGGQSGTRKVTRVADRRAGVRKSEREEI